MTINYSGNRLTLAARRAIGTGPSISAICSTNGALGLEFLPGKIQGAAAPDPRLIHSMFRLSYLCGSVLYHLERLAKGYAAICEDFVDFDKRWSHGESNFALYGEQQAA